MILFGMNYKSLFIYIIERVRDQRQEEKRGRKETRFIEH